MNTNLRHIPSLRPSAVAAALAATFAVAPPAALLTALLAAPSAHAQLSSATIQGQVTSGAAATPSAGSPVTATNQLNGYVYSAVTRADGSYVLTGVAPGTYRIKVGEQASEPVTVSVGQTSQVNLALQGGVQQVVITGSATRRDVAGSEVGTSVSRQQIEKLPQVTRNFLAFADLAPGVRFSVDNSGNVKLQSGSQNQDNVNVFIDGVSQKNNILRGGVSGLDTSRGNPFPQSAIAEYKVIAQNYKAEFDQVSSAAITAVTKSGGNELHGDAFWDHTGTNLTAKDPFQKKSEGEGIGRPKSSQDQYGMTLGGPIKQDVAHYFFAYEGKKIDSPRQVIAQRTDLLPNAGIVPSLLAQQGNAVSKFKEDLFLLKVDAQISKNQRVEATARVRREADTIPEDVKLSVAENVLNRTNDENRFDFKHEWSSDDFLNEARVGYEKYSWNPHSNADKPYIKYQVSPSNTDINVVDVLIVGGSPNNQFRQQSGLLLQDDLTYTGKSGHTMKTGFKVKHITYDLSGTAFAVERRIERIDTVTGLTNLIRAYPEIPAFGVNFSNNQYGIYFQDDWQASEKLLLNLGMRYDYEDNMLNDSYATPADRVALFGKQDPRDGAPAGQTYAQSLAKGGVNIGDYISTGNSRKAFKKALAPRLGLSYDINGDRASVLFAGWGRAYDRTIANHALDEAQKNAQTGGEIWMIKNDHKMAYTDMWSFGLRQALGIWNGEAGYTSSRSRNQFNWFGGNRDVTGGWGGASPIDPMFSSVPGYGTLVLGDFISQAKTDTAYLKMDKPYTKASTWSLGATYTYSRGETTNKEWTNEIFNWTYGRYASAWNPSTDVERHRLVVAGVSDGLLPWGLMMSGKVTLGSGLPYRVTDCSTGFNQCVSAKGDGDSFRQVDIGLSKELGFRFGSVALRVDVLNLFNSINYGGYDGWGGGPGNPQNRYGGDNKNVGTPSSMGGQMRTLKFSARYVF